MIVLLREFLSGFAEHGAAAAARAAARKFANRFEGKYPPAVACLRNDLDELLTCFRHKSQDQRRKVRTTNAIEGAAGALRLLEERASAFRPLGEERGF